MRTATLAFVLAAGVASGCATIPVFEPTEYSAAVTPRPGSDVRANVRAGTAPGQTAIAINMVGGQSGAAHPWHVHRGTCATGGAIVGDITAYPVLRPNSAGAATATALIRVQLVPGEDYHVNVHRSPDELGEIIACGDLR